MTRLVLNEMARCACGRVTVTVSGPVLSMLVCSCRDCRKSTGTGHSTVVLMPAKAVAAEGETTAYARTAASGSEIVRSFCPRCGTPLFARTARAPDVILIPAGLFEDPKWFKPSQAIFSRTHLGWDTLDATLPRHPTYRDGSGF